MLNYLVRVGAAIALTASAGVARAQAPGMAPPNRVERLPGESMADAVHRSLGMAYLQRTMGAHAAPVLRAGHTPASPPAIVSGKILSSTLDVTKAPAAAKLRFKYTSPGYLEGGYFEFVSPSGYQYYYTSFYDGFPSSKGGSATIQEGYNALGLYAEAGPWTLTYAYIYDFDETYAEYTASQLAGLFPSVTMNVVNHGKPDGVAPTVSSGKLLTPKVKLNAKLPVFKAQLTASDKISGVTTLYLYLEPPSEDYYYLAEGTIPVPVYDGSITTGIDLGLYDNVPTGTWTIFAYYICDGANICFEDDSSADIKSLFGTTTFDVTN
jgi:hypothetical protein